MANGDGTGAAANGRGSNLGLESWLHFRVERPHPAYCRVTFDHPPINAITATTVAELIELIGLIERDQDLNVVVFATANRDFYLAHPAADHDPRRVPSPAPGARERSAWPELLARLSRVPPVTIAAIRGRARGAGSEFVLACDLRFAARESAVLGQSEVATGLLPGAGMTSRLARLVGRGRALEILLLADDVDAVSAERHGYVNRTVPGDELDGLVDGLAARLVRFDRGALARTKAYVDQAILRAGGGT